MSLSNIQYYFSPQPIRQFLLYCFFALCTLAGHSQQNLIGKKISYSVNYSWIKIGEAEIFIDPELKYVNNQPHYQVQSFIKTSSFIGFFKSIDYCFESLINVKTGKPLISYRNLKTGDDLDVRTDKFSRSDSIRVVAYIEDIDKYRQHAFPKNEFVLDFLSTFLFFHEVDFKRQNSIDINTFYSNTLYPVTLMDPKKGKIKWDSRSIVTSEFSLYFPRNEYFKNDKHGKVILLDDDYKTAARIEFNMTLGKISFQLEKIE